MKRIQALIVACILMLSVFAGCGAGNTGADSGTAQDTGSISQTGGGNAENTSGTPDNTKEFTLRVVYSGDMVTDFVTAEMKKKYPGSSIEWINAPWGAGGKETRDKQLVLISSGEVPDVGMMIWGKEFFKEGILEDITDEVKQWDVYKKLTPGQLERMTLNGRHMGITTLNSTVYLFYNKDILSKVGVTSPPATMAEMAEIAKKIKDAQLKGPNGKPVYTISFEGGNWATDYWLWAGGGEQMNDDFTKTLIDSPESIKAFKAMQEYVVNGWAPKIEGTYDQLWLNGQLAFWPCGEWDLKATQDAKINAGYAVMPAGPTGKNTVSIGGSEWCIFKASEYKKEALDFLKILTTKEFEDEFDSKFLRASVDMDSYFNDPKRIERWKSEGLYEAKQAQMKQLFNSKYNFLEAPFVFQEASKIYNEALELMLIKLEDPETVMKAAAEKINAGIAEASR